MEKALLPTGLHDLLFPDAGQKSSLMASLARDFHQFGYRLVEPPVMEFENSLFTGAGGGQKQQTFRLMDPVSHKMMGVRSDITTQIVRIAATRLKKAPKPLRLAYGGDVFRVKGQGLYAERQLTQSGIELIGADSAAADAEVVLVVIAALKKLGLEGICVDFTLPRLVDIILADFKYKKAARTALIEVINRKNIAEIERLAGKNAAIFVKLAASGMTAAKLQEIVPNAAAKQLCTRLEAVLAILSASGEEVNISIDPLETDKFAYHSGIGFSIFVNGANGEIGRGGRYEIDDKEGAIPATGATIYLNEIMRILPMRRQEDKIFIPFGASWQSVKQLAQVGKMAFICGLEPAKDINLEAKKHGCNHVLANGKAVLV